MPALPCLMFWKAKKEAKENFFKKVIDGLLKLPYTDKCQRQAIPPQANRWSPLFLLTRW